MCDPVTLAVATFALSATSAGVSYIGQQQQADAQEAVERQRATETERYRQENARNAQQAFGENAAQLSIRQREEEISRTDERERIRREVRQQQGAAVASTTGGGISLDLILGEFARRGGAAVNTIETQAQFSGQQFRQELEGARARTMDAINSVRPYIPNPVVRPSPLGLAVDIGRAGLAGATTYSRLRYEQQYAGRLDPRTR